MDANAEDFYRRLYFATIDAALACLSSRFDSETFNLAYRMESTVVDAIKSESYTSVDLHSITEHFGDDINAERLKLHLGMFRDLCRAMNKQIESINDVVQCLQENDAWLTMFTELVQFVHLFLTIPVTSCTAERSFSSLKRLKTYLRTTMSQKRLNHVAILHCHHNKADLIDMKGVFNSFICRNDLRAAAFAMFPNNK